MTGPLSGLRIIEFAGIGPAPFAGMMLADHGAEVIRVSRSAAFSGPHETMTRGRRSIVLDLKQDAARAVARKLCASADGLIEGFRPGVMERLGLGPDDLLADNPALVYGRVTGWGQTGPLAHAAGHDINYVALSGILHTIGDDDGKPVVPANYLADFAGGGMMLAFGMLAALVAVKAGNPGQVVDAAMTEGSAVIGEFIREMHGLGAWCDTRAANMLDGAAHFYGTYQCSDGEWIAIGAIEPQFYALMLNSVGLAEDPEFAGQLDPSAWPALKTRLADVFGTRSRAEWCAVLEGTDACFAPVMSLADAPQHPHNIARNAFIEVGDRLQAAPAPRYSATPWSDPRPAPPLGGDTDAILAGLDFDRDQIAALRASGAVA